LFLEGASRKKGSGQVRAGDGPHPYIECDWTKKSLILDGPELGKTLLEDERVWPLGEEGRGGERGGGKPRRLLWSLHRGKTTHIGSQDSYFRDGAVGFRLGPYHFTTKERLPRVHHFNRVIIRPV